VLVPEFARELDGWVFSSYSSRFFISLLHSRGINVRHLGMVRHHVKCKDTLFFHSIAFSISNPNFRFRKRRFGVGT